MRNLSDILNIYDGWHRQIERSKEEAIEKLIESYDLDAQKRKSFFEHSFAKGKIKRTGKDFISVQK